MDHTPLQSVFVATGLGGRESAIAEGVAALAAALATVALRRRHWLINAGTFMLIAFGLVLDVFAYTVFSWPRLSGYLQAFALIFFYWGLVRIIVDLVFRPRGRLHYSTIPRDVVLLLLWLVVVAIVLYAEDFDVTKIFVSATVLSGGIVLALQEPLRNLFTGLTFQLGRAFQPGDWVTFQDREGYVKATSWSSTEIVTRRNERIQVPNSMLASQVVTNYHAPAIADEVSIGISYDDAPGRVKEAILGVVRDIPHVLSDPPPQVFAWEYGQYAIVYRVRYYLSSYSVKESVRDTLISSLWYALRRNAIDIPFPTQVLQMRRHPSRRPADADYEKEIIADLRRVDFLRGLRDEELQVLVPTVSVHQFGVGEVIVREGDAADSFFIIRQGTVDISAQSHGGAKNLAQLSHTSRHPFFGEAAMMSGEPRNATIRACTDVELLVMSRQGFATLFKENPALAEPMGDIIQARTTETRAALAEGPETDGHKGRRRWLVEKMRVIFDL
jgi:small-conductance mechanosensitive channel